MRSVEVLLSRTFSTLQNPYTAIPIHLSRKGYALPPRCYIMVMTCRCNLRCKMFILKAVHRNVSEEQCREKELSTQDWRGIIDQVHRFSMISFSGGEAFVRPDIIELLAYARKRHFMHLQTNLTMVSRGIEGRDAA